MQARTFAHRKARLTTKNKTNKQKYIAIEKGTTQSQLFAIHMLQTGKNTMNKLCKNMLNTCQTMCCEYLSQFKKWKPLRVSNDKNIIKSESLYLHKK